MAEDIPPEFDRPWSKSDVVLQTLNSRGKELHANKVALTLFSPYFDALFSGRFEKDVNSVNLNCNYNTMKEVLRNIHQIGFNYKSNGMKQYDLQLLKELYIIGDYYNFPHIRKLCLDQMTERPSVDMAMTAAALDLQDTLMEILVQIEPAEVCQFLNNKKINYLFTKKEVLRLFEKVVGNPLPRGPAQKSPTKELNLEEITVDIRNPRIDLTKLWETADVAISTKNSLGRLLYTSKAVMNTVSHKFKILPVTPVYLEGLGLSISSTTVDAEFTTMKILSVIHHCDTNYQGPPRVLHPALLHSMYRVASVNQLDIPMIRDLCVAELLKQKTAASFEVLRDLKRRGVFSLSALELRDWIYRANGSLSYRMGDEVVFVTPTQNKPHFETWMVLFLIDTCTKLANLA